jgi:transcriptional regulator with XRE-family HTH domain
MGLIVAPAMLHHATAHGEVFAGRVASALGDMRECEPAMGHDGSFGDVLHAVRTAKGWTQAEAGRRIGVARNTISRWELGQTTPTGIQRARALEVFGLVDAPLLPQALRELDERVTALERDLEERVAALERWRRELDEQSGPGRS